MRYELFKSYNKIIWMKSILTNEWNEIIDWFCFEKTMKIENIKHLMIDDDFKNNEKINNWWIEWIFIINFMKKYHKYH